MDLLWVDYIQGKPSNENVIATIIHVLPVLVEHQQAWHNRSHNMRDSKKILNDLNTTIELLGE